MDGMGVCGRAMCVFMCRYFFCVHVMVRRLALRTCAALPCFSLGAMESRCHGICLLMRGSLCDGFADAAPSPLVDETPSAAGARVRGVASLLWARCLAR